LNADTTPLRYNQTKGLTVRPNEKNAWDITLLAYPDILKTCEEGLHESEEEHQQTNQEKQPQNNTAKKTATSNQGKIKNATHGQAGPKPTQAYETETGSGGQASSCIIETQSRRCKRACENQGCISNRKCNKL
jgi:hypothetical protein